MGIGDKQGSKTAQIGPKILKRYICTSYGLEGYILRGPVPSTICTRSVSAASSTKKSASFSFQRSRRIEPTRAAGVFVALMIVVLRGLEGIHGSRA